jgi:hypothetical protein
MPRTESKTEPTTAPAPSPTPLEFEGTLERPPGTGTWTLVRAPARISEALGTRGRVPVEATVQGASLRGSLMPDGHGGHYLVVKKEVREAAGVTAGDAVRVALRVDASERTVEVPAELAAALEQNATASARYEAMSYSQRKEYADHVAEAKKAETRTTRAAKCVGMIAEGRRLKG